MDIITVVNTIVDEGPSVAALDGLSIASGSYAQFFYGLQHAAYNPTKLQSRHRSVGKGSAEP